MDIAATPLGERFALRSESDIVDVTYREGSLCVTVDTATPSGDNLSLEYRFDAPRGFRLLDEGDLLRYWASKIFEPGYHLFEVTAGGWRAQETSLSGMLSVSDAIDTREWFIATTNQCMNVLAADPPRVSLSLSEQGAKSDGNAQHEVRGQTRAL